MAFALAQRQLPPQAPVRSGNVVEGLEEAPPLPQALAVFAEAGRLAHPRRQGLPQGQVQPFDQGCTNPKLDFVQLRSIAERFSEALQQCAWDFNPIGLLWGR